MAIAFIQTHAAFLPELRHMYDKGDIMPWTKVVAYQETCCETHRPRLNYLNQREFMTGSEWKCPTCDTHWTIRAWTTAGHSNDAVPTWRKTNDPWPPPMPEPKVLPDPTRKRQTGWGWPK